jgi:hypothetical protein
MSTDTPLKSISPIKKIKAKDEENNENIEILNNTQNALSIKKDDKHEVIEVKQVAPPSLFYDFKKSLGLQEYSDGSFILYFFLIVFIIQRLNDVFSFARNILILPKQVSETYKFITKEDLKLLENLESLMNQLLGITGADRVAIAKIHNGTYDNTNAHEMKFSIVYETFSSRVKSTKAKIQSMPLDFIKEEISLGSTTDYQRFDRSNLDSMCDLYLDRVGIKTKYYKLLALNKHIYAVIEMHLIELPDEDFLTNKVLKKRVYKITNDIEYCLQSIMLKRTWIQKTFNKIFNIRSVF